MLRPERRRLERVFGIVRWHILAHVELDAGKIKGAARDTRRITVARRVPRNQRNAIQGGVVARNRRGIANN